MAPSHESPEPGDSRAWLRRLRLGAKVRASEVKLTLQVPVAPLPGVRVGLGHPGSGLSRPAGDPAGSHLEQESSPRDRTVRLGGARARVPSRPGPANRITQSGLPRIPGGRGRSPGLAGPGAGTTTRRGRPRRHRLSASGERLVTAASAARARRARARRPGPSKTQGPAARPSKPGAPRSQSSGSAAHAGPGPPWQGPGGFCFFLEGVVSERRTRTRSDSDVRHAAVRRRIGTWSSR